MPCRATQDRWVIAESSDKTWSTGEGNGKPLQYSCFENPMNSMKRDKLRRVEIGFFFIKEEYTKISYTFCKMLHSYNKIWEQFLGFVNWSSMILA